MVRRRHRVEFFEAAFPQSLTMLVSSSSRLPLEGVVNSPAHTHSGLVSQWPSFHYVGPASLEQHLFLCPSLEEGHGRSPAPGDRDSRPCYFNPLRDDLFNKCLSLFFLPASVCGQTEHVFCFPQIKKSIREGATERELGHILIYIM